jgi:hypothetical protein
MPSPDNAQERHQECRSTAHEPHRGRDCAVGFEHREIIVVSTTHRPALRKIERKQPSDRSECANQAPTDNQDASCSARNLRDRHKTIPSGTTETTTLGASVKSAIVTCNAITYQLHTACTIFTASTNCRDTETASRIGIPIQQELRRGRFVADFYSNMTSPGTTRIFS